MKIKQLFAGLTLMAIGLGAVQAEYPFDLVRGVTETSIGIHDLHWYVLWVCVFIGIAVFGTMFYSIYYHRKSRGYKASNFHESTKVEILWTIIPTIILIALAIPATKLMLQMEDPSDTEMTINVTGWQWKWEYEYPAEGIHFFSTLDAESNKARQLNSGIDPRSVPNYLLEVDNPLVLPINTKIRFVLTAADVIHSWWVPALGWKKDANPGFNNEAWTNIQKPGIYRGQCTELCGKDHGFMPIVVVALEKPEYEAWVAEQKGIAVQKAAAAEKEWSQEDLISKGANVYAQNCATCHMTDGAGISGTFPAITASTIVTGDINAQVDLVLNGKGGMPGFGQMLDAVDFAAVSTFIRNGLGNSVGDSIQPAAIKALQAAIPAIEYDDDDDDDE